MSPDETNDNPETNINAETNTNVETDNNVETSTLFADLFHSIPRHNLITTAVAGLLTEEATAQINEISGGMNFARFGGWADLIKSSSPPNDIETRRFLEDDRNSSHHQWHYVNLPLEVGSYRDAQQLGFTRDNDVIQIIRICVLVLKDESDRFSKLNALRLIAHLVGDVHQPLHIGCGFVDDSGTVPKLVHNPEIIKAKNLKSDTGGNDLLLPGSGNMHSYWDGKLGGTLDVDDITPLAMPSAAPNSETAAVDVEEEDEAELAVQAAKLRAWAQEVESEGGANLASSLPIERRAEEWANESLRASADAYRNIVIVARQGEDFKVSWEGLTTAAGKTPYDARCAPVLIERMKMGVRNMADMLNELFQ